MSKIVGDTACPKCIENGHDTTGNHLMLFEDGNGFCNRCGHKHFKNKDGELKLIPKRIKSPEEIREAILKVKELPIRALDGRAINKDTAKELGIRVGLSCSDGKTQIEHYYPYTKDEKLHGYNVRIRDPKGFYGVGSRRGVDPFNWYNARRVATRKLIIITEDELSAASVVEVFNKFTTDKQWIPAIISLATSPQGIIQDLGRKHIKEYIETFETIVFALDNDKAGKKGLDLILQVFPEAKYLDLPYKDPNDMKMAGKDIELYNMCRFNARRKQPNGSLTLGDMKVRMLADIKYGLSYPWAGLTKHTNGLLWGQVITIPSGVGLGKTLIANTLSAWFNKEHNIKSGMIMLEQPAEESGKAIVGAMTSQQFNDPNIPFSKKRLSNSIDEVGDNFYFYDAVRNASWEEIKPIIRHWVLVEGVKIVQLDNLTTMTAHLEPSCANTEINKIMAELAMMCKKYEFSIFVYSHLNPPKKGDTHEDGGEVKETQMTGSRGAMRYSTFIMAFERNRNSALSKEEQNISRMRLLKCRPIGSSPGIIGLIYNPATGLLDEREEKHLPKAPKEVFDGENI